MRLLGWLFSLSLVFATHALAATTAVEGDVNALQSVETSKDNGYFVTTYKFANAVNPESVSLEVQSNGVQVRFPGTRMFTDQNLVRVGKDGVKSIYTVQESQGQIRSRVIFDHDQKKSDTTDSVRVIGNANSIQVIVKNPSETWKTAANLGGDDLAPNDGLAPMIVADVPEKIIAEKIVADKTLLEKPTAIVEKIAEKPVEKIGEKGALKSAPAKKVLAESEIPVLNSVVAKKESSGNPWGRMIMSLMVIAILCGGLVVFSKWYSKNNKSAATNSKIRMLTQFHLGPKKSLAIVQVAGEAILIGVTDHNISMIKSLSLLDDEMPEATRGDFQETLDRSPGGAPARVQSNYEDEFIVSSIKDKITTKLKGLRPL